mgnify:CR=1 FL=1
MSLLIMADSNVIIDECYMPERNTSFWKAVRKSQADIAVDDAILSEVRRKTGKTSNEVLEKITKSFKKPVLIDDCQDVWDDARRMNEKYHYLHRGDDRILAATKKAGAVLVTNDKKFLLSASLEGIQAFSRKVFVRDNSVKRNRKWRG